MSVDRFALPPSDVDPLARLTVEAGTVLDAITGLSGTDPVVRPSDRADAQVNGALALAREVGRQPREIAEELAASEVLAGICSTAEVAGPGFVNVTFESAMLDSLLAAMAADERLGLPRATTPLTVVID
jgi:arginyl-tRNA synthetase